MPAPNTPVPAGGAQAPIPVVDEAAAALVRDSYAANTRMAYAGALRALETWLGDTPLSDASLANYLGFLDSAGAAPATARMVVAAVKARSKLDSSPSPVGGAATLALKGFARGGRSDRGRGQAPALTADQIADIANAASPRDKALVLVMFQACLRRSEASRLVWGDITPAVMGDAYRVRVRRSKTNQDGKPDNRLVKGHAAKALDAIRPGSPDDAAPVFGLSAASVGRCFKAAAAKVGITATAHSLRVAYASELTRRGASTTMIMRAGGWRTAEMVSHYASGILAEENATARFL